MQNNIKLNKVQTVFHFNLGLQWWTENHRYYLLAFDNILDFILEFQKWCFDYIVWNANLI